MEGQIERHLRALPRRPAPALALESILRRWARSRRQLTVAVSGLALILLASCGVVLLEPEAQDAPVHLHLRVLDVQPGVRADESVAAAAVAALEGPQEMQVP